MLSQMGVSTLHLRSKSLTADLEIANPLIARPIGNVKSASVYKSVRGGNQPESQLAHTGRVAE